MKSLYVVGDIGGTNSRFKILYKEKNNNFHSLFMKNYKTSDFKNFEKLFSKLRKDFEREFFEVYFFEVGLFGVAGKIDSKKFNLTNLNFEINLKKIEKNFNSLKFVNDIEAIGYYVLDNSKKTKLILTSGTGFGKMIIKDNILINSEGGHQRFIVENDFDYKLLNFLKTKKNEVYLEDVLSGRGVENIYEFLTGDKKNVLEISSLIYSNNHCMSSFQIFFRYFARFAREFCLDVLCDEIYLSGGVLFKNISIFDEKKFRYEFENNKIFKKYLKNINIKILSSDDIGILGLVKKLG